MIWNNIKLIFGVVKDVLSGNFSDAWEKIKEIFANVGEFFGGVWGNIKDAFANVITFFQSIFKIAWNAVKSVFANVGEFFGGIWETIKEKFSTIGTKVADAIGSAFKTAINAVIATVESAINLIPNAINGAIDLINNLPNVNISPIPTISLPRLAKGGVVRRATAAVVGEDGAEAVMPLERNTSWIDLLAEKLAEKTGGGVVVNQTNNYSQAHSRYEIYKSQQATAKAVKLAMAR
jgi:phage-related protein